MKNNTVVVGVIVFFAMAFAVRTDAQTLDGIFWLKNDYSHKLTFVTGWMDAGFVLLEYAKFLESKEKEGLRKLQNEFSHMDEKVKRKDPRYKERITELTTIHYDREKVDLLVKRIALDTDPVTVVDGLNVFYDDYKNRKIPVAWAIYYVLESMRGTPLQALQNYLEKLRRMASEARCDSYAPSIPRSK